VGGRDESPAWGDLGDDDLARLDFWLRSSDITLWHGGWFGDGRSQQPVGLVTVVHPETGAQRMVLKICASDGHARRLVQAWAKSPEAFRERHLLERPYEPIPLERRVAVLDRLAAGGLDDQVALSSRAEDGDFPEVCRGIVSSIMRDWNGRQLKRKDFPPTVREFLSELIGHRLGKVHQWAERSGISTDGGVGTVRRTGWAEPLTNPFLLLAQEPANKVLQDVLVGFAHGDLSGRNIRVPPSGVRQPPAYVLIDADHFAADAPLARDPMHLLVALALDHFDQLGPRERQDLVEAIVAPERGERAAHLGAVSAAIWEASAQLPRSRDFGDPWSRQSMLSLVGVGLVHVGRDLPHRDPDVARDWCFDLAAKAAEAYLTMARRYDEYGLRRTSVRPPVPPVPPVPPGAAAVQVDRVQTVVPGPGGMLDHDDERGQLRSALVDVGRGVVVVQGPEGVGKSILVETVLADVRRVRSVGPGLRVCRHEALPGSRFDVKTLIDDIAGGTEPAAAIRFGESSLTRLAATLEAASDRRVVVVVDAADNLVDRATRELIDLDLDEALEAIATTAGHRVCVVLIARVAPTSSTGATWPTGAAPIVLARLPYQYFLGFLVDLDRRNPGLSALPEPLLLELYRRLDGNPRRAELLHAILTLTESTGPEELARQLSTRSPAAVAQMLPTMLVDGLRRTHREVLAALGAYGIPVAPEMVDALVGRGRGLGVIRQALEVVTGCRLARRTGDGRFYIPTDDADWMLRGAYTDAEEPETKIAELRWKAADELSNLRVKDPKDLADLGVHFAELDALLRAGQAASAYGLVHEIDRFLSWWNCGDRLLDQRTDLVGKLVRPGYEMANDNELGALFAARGKFDQAAAAYERAGSTAAALDDAASLVRIVSNIAAMHWQRNDLRSAAAGYEEVRLMALSLGEGTAPVLMGALEGLADCHRRRGDYDAALRWATEALAVPESPDYPDTRAARDFAAMHTVNISLKLARWYAELGRTGEARTAMDGATAAEAVGRDAWLEASCLDGQADLALFDGDVPRAMARANAAIDRAGKLHDPITLLQARSTLCLAHLIGGSPSTAAAREIERAIRHRRKGRSFIALALRGLVARLEGRRRDAATVFDQLLAEAGARADVDARDFGAWDFAGFARCGRALDGGSLNRAIDAFRTARTLTPPTPGLTARLHVLVGLLDSAGSRPGRLRPVTDLLEDAAGRTDGR
jgi:tetratricopeptide (TPR) repeat protein